MLHANIRKRSFAFRYLTLSVGETFSKVCVLVAFGYLVAWFNGHFRFSLVAAGQQWWEFIVAVATAAVTIAAGLLLSYHYGSVGAASALLLGGVTNTFLAMVASHRRIGYVAMMPYADPALLTTAVSLAVGVGVGSFAGVLPGTVTACLFFVIVAARQDNDMVRLIRVWTGARP